MTPEPGRTWASRQIVETYPVTVICRGESKASTVLVHWDPEDPAAVMLAVDDPWTEKPTTVEWFLARNLLVGAHLPGFAGQKVGLGDARVVTNYGQTTIDFSSPNGACSIVVDAELMTAFLGDCARVIPVGSNQERAVIFAALDRELAELLDGAL